jgi:ActR/RegA family two-component response regulator
LFKSIAVSPTKLKLLVVEDDSYVGETLEQQADDLGFAVTVVDSVAQAYREIECDRYAVAVVDWRLRDGLGTDVLSRLAQQSPETFRVMYSAHAEAEAEATALSAHDFIDKGASINALRFALRRGERFARARSQPAAAHQPNVHWSSAVQRCFDGVGHGSVLVVPETGRVPDALLETIAARPAPCAAVRVNLLHAEPPTVEQLLGGAGRRGLLDHPAGITLLAHRLSAWGEPARQALAAAVFRGTIRRLNSDRDILTQVRLVAAADPGEPVDMILEGAVLTRVILPGFQSDDGLVADRVAAQVGESSQGQAKLSEDAVEMIRSLGFMWNVAELDHAVRAALAKDSSGQTLTLGQLGVPLVESVLGAYSIPDLNALRRSLDRAYLLTLMGRNDNNVTRVATAAKMSRQTVYKMLEVNKNNP